jgi:DNA topoisomerase-1
VKHGTVNATVRDRDRVDALTLDEALALLAEKEGKPPKEKPAKRTPTARKPASPKVAEPKAAAPKAAASARGFVPVVKTGRSKLATPKPKSKPKTGKPAAPKPKARAATAKKR